MGFTPVQSWFIAATIAAIIYLIVKIFRHPCPCLKTCQIKAHYWPSDDRGRVEIAFNGESGHGWVESEVAGQLRGSELIRALRKD